MAGETGTLGLRLEADVSAWDAAFAKAGGGAQRLAKEVNVATGGMSSAEKQAAALAAKMEQAAKNASALNSIKWSQLLQGLQAATGMLTRFVTQGVEMAKFSAEFQRLEKAIPAEKMRQLQIETQGTVSKFDLLTQAAKELNLSATTGMDASTRAMKQTLVQWENYIDGVKRVLGDLFITILNGLDRISSELAGTGRLNLLAPSLTGVGGGGNMQALLAAQQAKKQGRRDALASQAAGMPQFSNVLEIDPAAIAAANKRGGGRGAPALTAGGGHGGMAYGPAQWLGPAGEGGSTFAGLGKLGGGIGDMVGGAGRAASGAAAGVGAGQRDRMADLARDLGDTNTALGAGFGLMQTGIAAAVEAAITGSESIGKAWMRAVGQQMKAEALKHTAMALGSGAMALGALALGNPAGAAIFGREAAMHAAAAAAFGAGAALAGGGGGGAGAAPSSPGGGYVSRGAGGGGGGNTTVVYEIHGVFSAATHRELGAQLVKSQQKAITSGTARQDSTRTARVE